MDKVPWFLEARKPLGAIIEEVASILKPDRSGQIACEMLVDSLRGLFAGIEVVLLDAAVWGTVSRSRPRSHHISYPDLYEVT
jgi:hypothetical protein